MLVSLTAKSETKHILSCSIQLSAEHLTSLPTLPLTILFFLLIYSQHHLGISFSGPHPPSISYTTKSVRRFHFHFHFLEPFPTHPILPLFQYQISDCCPVDTPPSGSTHRRERTRDRDRTPPRLCTFDSRLYRLTTLFTAVDPLLIGLFNRVRPRGGGFSVDSVKSSPWKYKVCCTAALRD